MSRQQQAFDPVSASHLVIEPNLVAVVPVRAGSKGLLGKNLRPLAGKPLYLHAVHQGLRIAGRVVITTDIQEIQQANLPAGCEVCPRPPALAGDDSPMAPVISHLIEAMGLQDSTLVLLQATTPLRADSDIKAAISLHDEQRHELVMSVVARDRGVLKYGLLKGDDFNAMRDPAFCFANRQDLPPVYAPNGAVYVFKAASFITASGFPTEHIGAIEMPDQRSIDIDSEKDFNVAQKAMEQVSNR
tara:strand:+ start:7312 stop:8043 length:732 start_codon:yes stop_codon:yes gene_type:complete